MARPGRPSSITPAIAAKIADLSQRGLRPSAIARALAAAGTPLSLRTVRRHLAAVEAQARLAEPVDAEPTPAPRTNPARLESTAEAALSSDDLAAIAGACSEVEAGMRQWASGIGIDPTSTRAYAALARLSADLRTRMAALRPQPEVERERFAEFGHGAMTELVERARQRAETDWQGRYRRAMALSVPTTTGES